MDLDRLATVGEAFVSMGLLAENDLAPLLAFLGDRCPFGEALRAAESIHLHSRVESTTSLPHEAIVAAGGVVANTGDGYVKYAFDGGVNMIFSTRSEEPEPDLDHLGIDLRAVSDDTKAIFDAIPERAKKLGWGHVPQGDEEGEVSCCFAAVQRKHWVYPRDDSPFTRPIEIAFGPLELRDVAGVDLRPPDPAAKKRCCG